jgi:hypothetical protein
MYTFTISDKGADIDSAVTRSLLALAAVTTLLYSSSRYYFINVAVAGILLAAAVFVKKLLLKLKGNTILLLLIAAILVLFVTRSFIFPLIMVLCGLLVKKLYITPGISITTQGVSIKKMQGNQQHHWDEFSNIILKDNLLTLDFKNNKLLQLTISEGDNKIDEYSFNIFCSGLVGV